MLVVFTMHFVLFGILLFHVSIFLLNGVLGLSKCMLSSRKFLKISKLNCILK